MLFTKQHRRAWISSPWSTVLVSILVKLLLHLLAKQLIERHVSPRFSKYFPPSCLLLQSPILNMFQATLSFKFVHVVFSPTL